MHATESLLIYLYVHTPMVIKVVEATFSVDTCYGYLRGGRQGSSYHLPEQIIKSLIYWGCFSPISTYKYSMLVFFNETLKLLSNWIVVKGEDELLIQDSVGIPDVTDQDIVSTSIINGLLLCFDLDNYGLLILNQNIYS